MSYASVGCRKGVWYVAVYSAGHVELSYQTFDSKESALAWAHNMGFEKIWVC